MFKIYIKNYKNTNGVIVSTSNETELLSIPALNASGFPIEKPTVKASEDSADSLDFTMESNSPYYDALVPFKTLLRVVYDGDTIFFGRVITVSASTVFQTKSVHCEGAYAFMNDTSYEGKNEKVRQKISLSTYIDRIISNHNSMVDGIDNYKKIYLGTIGFTPTTETRKYEPGSWTETATLFNGLTNEFGGHTKVRYNNSNGKLYIDWYKYFARDLGNGNRPVVEVKKNIIDLSNELEVDDLFTKVIPVGDTDNSGKSIYISGFKYTDKNGTEHTHSGKIFPVELINDLYSDSQLNDDFHSASDYSNAENDYGAIYKVQTFSDADTKAKLWNLTKKWVKDSYFGISSSFTVTAIDMHIIDDQLPKILVGDCVDIYYYIKEGGALVKKYKKLVCKSASYDLFNPEGNSYTFGIPSDLLDRKYSESKKKKKTVSAAEAPKPVPSGSGDNDNSLTFEKIYDMLLEIPYGNAAYGIYGGVPCADSFWANGEYSGTIDCYDPDELTLVVNNYSPHPVDIGFPSGASIIDTQTSMTEDYLKYDPHAHPEVWFKAQLIGKITMQGLSVKWIAYSADRGIFAFEDTSDPLKRVTLWYNKRKGYIYQPHNPAIIAGKDYSITTLIKDIFMGPAGLTWTGQIPTEPTPTPITDPIKIKFDLTNGLLSGVVAGIFNGLQPVAQVGPDGKTTLVNKDTNKPTVELDPSTQKVKVGKDTSNDWQVTINDSITYVDDQGVTRTLPAGAITAKDFNLPEIPSFKTKTAVIDNLIAGRATVEQFNALEANFNSLSARAITTNNLDANIANLDHIQVKGIVSSAANADCVLNNYYGNDYLLNVSGGGGSVSHWSIKNFIKEIRVSGPTNDQYTLEYKRYSDSDWQSAGNFNKAASIENAGAWSGSGRTGVKWTVTESSTNQCIVELADGNATGVAQPGTWNGRYYTGNIAYVTAETGGTKRYGTTGLTYQVDGKALLDNFTEAVKTDAPRDATYTTEGNETYINNSSGYWIDGSGQNKKVRIVVRVTWKQGGYSITKYNYLGAAPSNIYAKAWADSRSGETAITMTRGAYNSNSRTYTCTCEVNNTIATGSTFKLYAR